MDGYYDKFFNTFGQFLRAVPIDLFSEATPTPYRLMTYDLDLINYIVIFDKVSWDTNKFHDRGLRFD